MNFCWKCGLEYFLVRVCCFWIFDFNCLKKFLVLLWEIIFRNIKMEYVFSYFDLYLVVKFWCDLVWIYDKNCDFKLENVF